MSASAVMTVAVLLEWARAEMKGMETPDVEAQTLLSGVLGCSRTRLFLLRETGLSLAQVEQFRSFVARRKTGEPVAYLLGTQPFGDLLLNVTPDVLIPRPETEWVAEQAVLELKKQRKPTVKILDIGTGSGCLAIGLARQFPASRLIAVDVSSRALAVASRNAQASGVLDRVKFIESDLYSTLPTAFRGDFDMILSNPPYVATPDLTSLSTDLSFEPRLALDGGPDGLRIIERLVVEAPPFLRTGGVLMLEIGFDQGARVASLMNKQGFAAVEIKKDLNDRDRLAKGEWRGPV